MRFPFLFPFAALRRLVRRRQMQRLKPLPQRFFRAVGYRPDPFDPKTHNEKVMARKLFDRNPLFPILCDKIAVRDHVRRVLGAKRAEAILRPLLGTTRNPTAAWLQQLGQDVAIKANHGSGWNVLIEAGKDAPDYAVIEGQLRDWLGQTYGVRQREWAYSQVPPQILAEPLLRWPDGRLADDLKLGVYGGRVRTCQVEKDRFGDYGQAYFDRDWNRLPMQMRHAPGLTEAPPRPVFLAEMIEIAEAVAGMLDYARVDFLYSDRGFALNEITLYRSSGMVAFEPPEWDRIWGDWWDMRMVRPKGFIRRWLT